MQRRPCMFAERPCIWICAAQLGVEFPNGNISDISTAQVQQDVLQVQNHSGINNRDINMNCVVADAFQVHLTNDNGTQKWRVDAIDGGGEALLAGEPPDPQSNSIGNRYRREQDGRNRHEHDYQANEEDSISKRHAVRRRGD